MHVWLCSFISSLVLNVSSSVKQFDCVLLFSFQFFILNSYLIMDVYTN